MFYDRTGAGPLGDLLLYNGQVLLSYLVNSPSYPNPGPLGSVPSNIVQLDQAIREPYSLQYSLGLERQLAKTNDPRRHLLWLALGCTCSVRETSMLPSFPAGLIPTPRCRSHSPN